MTDPKLPPLPAVTPGPLYQAIIIDGDCTEEFVEYVQAYARAAVELAGGGRDGERYRWLRDADHGWEVFLPTDKNASGFAVWDGCTDKDAAIDAAMTGGEHGNG